MDPKSDISIATTIGLFIGATGAIVAIATYLHSKSKSKDDGLEKLVEKIRKANTVVEEKASQIEQLTNGVSHSNETESLLLDELNIKIHSLLGIYNEVCLKFYHGKLRTEDFKIAFHEDIKDQYEGYRDLIEAIDTRYSYLIRYYNEHHRPFIK